jgi:hypothetical protein
MLKDRHANQLSSIDIRDGGDAPGEFNYMPLRKQSWQPLSSQMLLFSRISSFLANCGMDVRCSFAIDFLVFEKAINAFLKVHPIFFLKLGRGFYKVHPYTPIKLGIVDLQGVDNQQLFIDKHYETFVKRRFVYDGSPLFQATLFQISAESFSFLFSFPHLIGDYGCIRIAIDAIFENYFLLKRGMEPSAYKASDDYLLKSVARENALKALWATQKSAWEIEANSYRHIAVDDKNVKECYSGSIQNVSLSRETLNAFAAFCAENKCKKSIGLMAITALAICSLTNQKECSVEFVLHGRNEKNEENCFGPFTTNVPLNISFSGDEHVGQFIQNIAATYRQNQPFSSLGSPLCSPIADRSRDLSAWEKVISFLKRQKLKLQIPKARREVNLDYYCRGAVEEAFDRHHSPRHRKKLRLTFNSYTIFTAENCKTENIAFDAFKERSITHKGFFQGKADLPILVIFFFKLQNGDFNLMIPASPLTDSFEVKILEKITQTIDLLISNPSLKISALISL